MATHAIARLQDLVGTVDTSAREKAWISVRTRSSSRSTSRRATRRSTLADSLRGIGRRLQDRQPPVHRRRTVDRPRAHRARRPRLPRPEVPRHPEHRRDRGRGGDVARRLDGERARERRHRDDARGAGRGAGDAAAKRGTPPPLVIAVTVLTSMNQAALRETGIVDRPDGSGPAAGRAGEGGGARRRRRLAARDAADSRALRPGLRDRDAGHSRQAARGAAKTIRNGR